MTKEHADAEDRIRRKYAQRDKRTAKKMKVSAGAKKLHRILRSPKSGRGGA